MAPRFITSETLDVVTLNVAHGRGTALNQILVRAAQQRKNLEQVAALQEADTPSLWNGRFDHV